MSRYDKIVSAAKEPAGMEVDVSFLCMTCDEPVHKAVVTTIDDDRKRIEWTCSHGHTSSMKWML